MDRRAFVAGTLGFLAAPLAGEAQQAGRIYRIGVLSGASSPLPVDHPAFLKALRELGYVPGQNLILEERYAGGTDRLPALAAELAGLNVDVMVTIGTPAARAAKAAPGTIPVVFTIQADPVGRGLVASLARPGGNLTGLAAPAELDSKELEVLKEAVPGASRLAYLWDANYGPASASTWVTNWDAVGIDDDGVGQAAQLEELMPVAVVARQARDFETEDRAGAAQTDIRDEALKARAAGGRGAGFAEVLVRHGARPHDPSGGAGTGG